MVVGAGKSWPLALGTVGAGVPIDVLVVTVGGGAPLTVDVGVAGDAEVGVDTATAVEGTDVTTGVTGAAVEAVAAAPAGGLVVGSIGVAGRVGVARSFNRSCCKSSLL